MVVQRPVTGGSLRYDSVEEDDGIDRMRQGPRDMKVLTAGDVRCKVRNPVAAHGFADEMEGVCSVPGKHGCEEGEEESVDVGGGGMHGCGGEAIGGG